MERCDDEPAFLRRRRRLLEAWRYVGPGLVGAIVSLGAWLYVRAPLLANPALVLAQLRAGCLKQQDIELMAAMLPFAVWALLVLCLAGVLFGYASFASERRYLDIIARQAASAGQAPGGAG